MKKFLVIMFLLFFLYACSSTDDTDDFRADESESKDFSSSQMTKVEVENVNGSIKSSVWSDESIHVLFEKWATGKTEQEAQANIGNIEIYVNEDAVSGVLSIDVDIPINVEVDYGCNITLQLPSSLSLDLESINGDIEIQDTKAEATLKTANGEITTRNHNGDLIASSSNGTIDTDIVLPDQGECMLSTLNGSIILSIPDTTSAMIDASTANGTVEVDANLGIAIIREEKKDFEGKMGNGKGNIELTTVNGDIRVEKR
jgi:DUF4097 and DUF4098 domain-containing protein YvlB